MPQPIEHTAKNRSGKRRVEIENCSCFAVSIASILPDEVCAAKMQSLSALPGSINVSLLNLDSDTVRRGTNRSQQRHVAHAGAEVHEHIVCRQPGFFKKVEDEARRGGLVQHFFRLGANTRIFRFIEAEDAGHEFVQAIVVVNA